MNPTHVLAGAGDRYPMIDGDHVAKATLRDAAGAFEAFEVIAPAAPPAPPHVSPWSALLYLLEGTVAATVDGTTYDVTEGGLVVIPAGTPATFQVTGHQARFLAITTGDGAGRFFADFARTVPLDQPIEAVLPAILTVTARHGVTVTGPQ